ncbi:MAG: helicase-related protein, partial [Patescibacteria group bacterium]
ITGGQTKVCNWNQESGIKNQELPKKEMLKKIRNGEINIVVGTHALIQESVSFANLGLTIVDEQHRFGVEQRKNLRHKAEDGGSPHFLSMTATPIPRSFALTLYGDLDISLIKQMPVGRQKIITKLVDETNRSKAYDFIRQQIKSDRQAFVVCPLIEPSGEPGVFSFDDRRSVKEEYEKLKTKIFPELNIAMLHGKLKSKDKDAVMKDFLDKKYDVLVSTSVVEVGVDIPNATIMMIEGADRFGLAQLHQFRGRVGRGTHQSYCLLFSSSAGAATKERLNYFVTTNDGFILAEKDLALRGPGELFGAIQHGFPELKMADLKDLETIKKAREAAKEILSADPKLTRHPAIKERLDLWQREAHLE